MNHNKYPSWLSGHVKRCSQQRVTTLELCSSAGNELLEVWYYGDLYQVPNEELLYIVNSDSAPVLIVGRDPKLKEEFVIFDGAKHGYSAMFCDEYEQRVLATRTLRKYDIPASLLIMEVGYSIDYEDEKEEYALDERNRVELINGELMPWEQIVSDGVDYIALSFIDEQGVRHEFVSFELA